MTPLSEIHSILSQITKRACNQKIQPSVTVDIACPPGGPGRKERTTPADEWQPLEPDDVPPGTVVRWGADEGWHMVNCVLSEYIFVPSGRDKQWWCFREMFRREDFLIKRPGEDWTRARKPKVGGDLSGCHR